MLKALEMTEKAAHKPFTPSRRAWLRRQANHIVAQLPEDEAEALFVLESARRLVEEYLRDEDGRNLRPVPRVED